ncbi:MAG: hypothetical protein KC478_15695 [Bacteriovoracaceae bacterium]|nr:hypothetical protein [Bacteriovoracaceae bacterium]
MAGLCPDREVYLGNKVPKGEAKNTLLLFTHSLNEMGAEKAQQYIELVKPSVILLMEPGTKDAFAKTLELRQWCVSKGFNVSYPCFSNSPCPLNLEEDWCHQYLKTRHAQDVESMTQKLGRDRKLLPMTIHLYTIEELSKNQAQEHTARLVRVYKQTKHSFEWMLCKEVEGQNITFNVEVPKRGMSKKEIKAFEEIMAGEKIHYSVVKEMEQKIRIKLI